MIYHHVDIHWVTRIEVVRNPYEDGVSGVQITFYDEDGMAVTKLFVYGTPTLEVKGVE